MRIAGIDIPDNKRGEIALTYIYGLGRSSAIKILKEAGISVDKKVSEWTEEESNKIRNIIISTKSCTRILNSVSYNFRN